MVERLAKLHSKRIGGYAGLKNVRWWLNAIADELEQANEIWSDQVVQDDAAAWLRTQANEASDE